MKLDRLVRANPSGNKTAIVFDAVAFEDMRFVDAAIQHTFPDTEQVLFVQDIDGTPHGQMTGGEFCGNAARALGYVLAGGKKSEQLFTMSGLSTPVRVSVEPNASMLEMQTAFYREISTFSDGLVDIVHLEGISHAVILPRHPLFYTLKNRAERLDRHDAIMGVLADLEIVTQPASGLVFAEPKEDGVHITPYIYVRGINTLHAEQACASGSIAAASIMGIPALQEHLTNAIKQPSGETLNVALDIMGMSLHAKVSGAMQIIYDGAVDDMDETNIEFEQRLAS
jgi:diaminopimelate epimerase